MMKVIMDIKTKLDKVNYSHTVKIRCKTKRKKQSLYLEYNRDNKRQYFYPDLFLTNDKIKDDQILRMIQRIRDEKEQEIYQGKVSIDGFSMKSGKKFLSEHASPIISTKRKRTAEFYKMGVSSLIQYSGDMHLIKYSKKTITNWLNALTISLLSKHNYLQAVKYIFKLAVEEKLIPQNPCDKVTCSYPESKREFLTLDEVQQVYNTDFDVPVVKDAFLFSCYTGLRLGDIRSLRWVNIVDGYIEHTQNKTGHSERLKLHPVALEIIDRQPRVADTVFLLNAQKSLFKHIKRLIQQSQITKTITFHCARHTFATLLLTYDEDIYTVSKLLGHKDVKTTQIYAKIIDKKKDAAIDNLPSLKSNLSDTVSK